jgi:hypothetical protein
MEGLCMPLVAMIDYRGYRLLVTSVYVGNLCSSCSHTRTRTHDRIEPHVGHRGARAVSRSAPPRSSGARQMVE